MSFPVPNSILRLFNSIYLQKACFFPFFLFSFFPFFLFSFFPFFLFSFFPFFPFFPFFMQDALLFPIVFLDFSIVSTEKMLLLLSFYFLYEKFPAIANSILSFPNSIYWENTSFFIFSIFSPSFSAIVHSILGFLNCF